MRKHVLAAISGVLFALGLALGGMLDTRNVIGFLDVTGPWDPRLSLVLGGAVMVFAPAHRIGRSLARKKGMEHHFHLPALPLRDPKLVIGAVLFGVGWGLVGYCPGPAVVSVGAAVRGVGTVPTLAFTGAMLAGMVLHQIAAKAGRRTTLEDELGEEDRDEATGT